MSKPELLEIRRGDFLAFIDETGNDSLSDPNHRVFGLGGCAIPATLYEDVIVRPWLNLKRTLFADYTGPLHAAELSDPTRAQLNGLREFFASQAFMRVACLVSSASSSTAKARAYEKCSETVLAFLHQCVPPACDRILITFESLHRGGNAKPSAYLNQQTRFVGVGREYIPVRVVRGLKRDCHPGLEVADFIMHAAGGQIRRGFSPDVAPRQDFSAVFTAVPDAWVRFGFLEIAEEDQTQDDR